MPMNGLQKPDGNIYQVHGNIIHGFQSFIVQAFLIPLSTDLWSSIICRFFDFFITFSLPPMFLWFCTWWSQIYQCVDVGLLLYCVCVYIYIWFIYVFGNQKGDRNLLFAHWLSKWPRWIVLGQAEAKSVIWAFHVDGRLTYMGLE